MSEADTKTREKLSELGAMLRRHWHSFCDADPLPMSQDEFTDPLEEAGLIEFVAVTKAALQEPFAAERGIEKGGMMWQLTKAGHTAFKEID